MASKSGRTSENGTLPSVPDSVPVPTSYFSERLIIKEVASCIKSPVLSVLSDAQWQIIADRTVITNIPF
jgi:hypothetical protein